MLLKRRRSFKNIFIPYKPLLIGRASLPTVFSLRRNAVHELYRSTFRCQARWKVAAAAASLRATTQNCIEWTWNSTASATFVAASKLISMKSCSLTAAVAVRNKAFVVVSVSSLLDSTGSWILICARLKKAFRQQSENFSVWRKLIEKSKIFLTSVRVIKVHCQRITCSRKVMSSKGFQLMNERWRALSS